MTPTNRTRAWCRIALALALCIDASAATNDPVRMPFAKKLTPQGPSMNRRVGRFVFDDELLAAADETGSGMRVVRDGGGETPFLIRAATKPAASIKERGIPSTILSYRHGADDRIEIVLENKAPGSVPRAIELAAGAKDYTRQAAVSGSRDGVFWEVLNSIVPVFEYRGSGDFRNTRIDLKPTSFAYYKVEVSGISEPYGTVLAGMIAGAEQETTNEAGEVILPMEDFEIEDVKLIERVEVAGDAALTREHAVHAFQCDRNQSNGQSVVTFEIERVPLKALTFFAREDNFRGRMDVYGRDDADRGNGDSTGWIPIASTPVAMVNIGGLELERNRVEFDNAARFRRYRLVIGCESGDPATVYGVKAQGQVLECVFAKEPKAHYSVLFGAQIGTPVAGQGAAALARHSASDAFSLSASRANAEPPPVSAIEQIAGKLMSNAAPAPKQAPIQGPVEQPRKKLLAWAVVVMAGTLVWLIAMAMRDMARRKREE